jgi:hypothetical protein
MFINIPNNPKKIDIIKEIINILSNIAISNKKYVELLLLTKIPQFIKQISNLSNNNNKLLIEVVIFFNNLIINSTEENFEMILNFEPFRPFENLLKSTMIDIGIYYSLSGIYEILNRIYLVKKEKFCWLDVMINSNMQKIESFCYNEDKKINAKAKMLVDKYNEIFNADNGNIKMETENF